MVFFVLFGAAAAFACGGKLRNLEHMDVRLIGLPIAAFGCELVCAPLFSALSLSGLFFDALPVILEYALLTVFLAVNFRRGLFAPVCLAGTVMNFLVIACNAWRMPVSRALLSGEQYADIVSRLQSLAIAQYALATDTTRLPFLGDVLKLELFGHLFGCASIGDLLIGAGAMMLIFHLLRPVKKGRRCMPPKRKRTAQPK